MTDGYKNRRDAGRKLAEALSSHRDAPDTIILALPRGGVPVADEVAQALNLPLDIWLVRKLGVPGNEELAMGAIAVGDVVHMNDDVVRTMRLDEQTIARVIADEQAELTRRNDTYRAGQPAPDVAGKTVIVVDDGLATGATMQAALQSLRKAGAARLVAAIPVGADYSCRNLEGTADEVVCPLMPAMFYGVGQFYEDFGQTSDAEVVRILGNG